MYVQTYLLFEGRCEEAMNFYRDAIDAQIEYVMRFKDSPVKLDPGMTPAGGPEKIFHATLRIGETTLGVADTKSGGPARFDGFALLLKVADTATAEQYFAALADGGQVRLALHETFFSPRFGIVADRFGVTWKIQVVA